MSRRTRDKLPSHEGLVLKELRTKHKLTLIEVAKVVGVSDGYISQVENGRSDPPTNETLDALLKAYGGISQKYFYELVREKKNEETDFQYISKVFEALPSQDQKFIRQWIEFRLRGEKNGK